MARLRWQRAGSTFTPVVVVACAVATVVLLVAHTPAWASGSGSGDGGGSSSGELIVGGKICSLDVECGIPTAFLPTTREETLSSTGSCVEGRCACVESYGCEACNVRVEQGSLTKPWLSAPFDPAGLDMCTIPYGGGVCEEDHECFTGLCIDEKCVCYSGWACEYCQLAESEDLRKHGTCGEYVTGGRDCTQTESAECVNGQCVASKCQCYSGYTCQDCSQLQEAVAAGTASCGCIEGQCSGHGTCSAGVCSCDDEWSGSDCTINVCDGVSCSGHGTCVHGECECDEGFVGADCGMGGGSCATNADCGVWAPMELTPDDPDAQCKYGFDCVDDMYGGTCDTSTGHCVCNNGFTCPLCDAKGYFECDQASGGGACFEHSDCRAEGAESNGGFCYEGRCICYVGYSCPRCEIDRALGPGEECPVYDPAQSRGGAPCAVNQDCGVYDTGGTGGTCTASGRCECFDGFHCPDCNTFVAEGDELGECGDDHIGAECTVNGECSGHGACLMDDAGVKRCHCNGGWACDYCHGRKLDVGQEKVGKCTVGSECGNGDLQGGECVDGECVCYPGFLCSHCSVTQNSGAECPEEDYVQEGDPVECPVRRGGFPCTGPCGDLGGGLFGGYCNYGACACYDDYTCGDCSKTKTEVQFGAECPEFTDILDGAATVSVSAAATLVVACAAALAALHEA